MVRMQPHPVLLFQPLGNLPSRPGPVGPREFFPQALKTGWRERTRAAGMRLVGEGVEAAVPKAAQPAANALLAGAEHSGDLGHPEAGGVEADHLQAVPGPGLDLWVAGAPLQLLGLFWGQVKAVQRRVLQEDPTAV